MEKASPNALAGKGGMHRISRVKNHVNTKKPPLAITDGGHSGGREWRDPERGEKRGQKQLLTPEKNTKRVGDEWVFRNHEGKKGLI